MRTCMCVVVSVLVTLAFSIHHWLAACCEKESRVRKSFLPVKASHAVRPMWPRYGILHEVIDGNWAPHGPRQNHKVSEEVWPLDARHASPTGEWIRSGACKPNPQLWVNSPTALWVTVESQRLWETTQKEIRTDAIR